MSALLKKVAVIGASGKMGRGIASLVLNEMVLSSLSLEEGEWKAFRLSLIDVDETSFIPLKESLIEGMRQFAEKKIRLIREGFQNTPELISNGEMIEAFLKRGMLILDCGTSIEEAYSKEVIFEAIYENKPLKVDILKKLGAHSKSAVFLSNTSSIPISTLAEESGLNERLIGFHFYNPPPVQKLLEIIPSKYTGKALLDFSQKLAERLGKKVVLSKDVPGFIGNGHFSLEISLAFRMKEALEKDVSPDVAIQMIDKVTRDFLLRPMGIFQLIDYVGLEVASSVLQIVKREGVDPNALLPYIEKGILGGQTSNGMQKNGIFSYEKGKLTAIFSLDKASYVPLVDLEALGVPPSFLSYRALMKDPKKVEDLPAYFNALAKDQSLGSKLAKDFLVGSKQIETRLVEEKVANSIDDVGTVLKTGFHHAYAPHEVIL